MGLSKSSADPVLVVADAEALTALRSDWNSLASDHGQLPIFASHDWFDAALQWQSPESQLHIMCQYQGKDLAGVLPLVSRVVDGGLRHRELTFLTVPDTQRCDLIASEATRAGAVAAFADALHLHCRHWDVMRLRYLSTNSLAANVFGPALRARGCITRLREMPANPYIALDADWTAFYATRSRGLKKANNLAANRLHRAGAITIEHFGPQTQDRTRYAALLEQAVAISSRSWKSGTGNSLDHAGPLAFIRRLSAFANERAWLSIWILSLGGQPIAMEYQLADADGVYALRSDFDAEFELLSPGSHLFRVILEELHGSGRPRYYMGPGNNPYKKRWTETSEPVYELTVFNNSARGRLLAMWESTLRPIAVRAKGYLTGARR